MNKIELELVVIRYPHSMRINIRLDYIKILWVIEYICNKLFILIID